MLKYISFRVYEDELEFQLNRYAQLGFQVTTCEPVIVPSPEGRTVSVSYIIIMARYPDPEEPSSEEAEGEGMAIKS